MINVYVNRAPVRGPWGGGNQLTKAFFQYAKDFDVNPLQPHDHITAPDAALVLALDDDPNTTALGLGRLIGYKMMMNMQGSDCKLILRVNENDARKGTKGVDDVWVKASQYVDATVWVSNWLQGYYGDRWMNKTNKTIINGVDRDVFHPAEKTADNRLHIIAHHWSDNFLKGADIYNFLDRFVGDHPDDYTFTYIGRHKCDFKHTKVVNPLSGKRLGDELGKYDVYVSGTRWDPAPNHCLEAMSCGMPIYVHCDGGGAVELVGQDLTYKDEQHLASLLQTDLLAKRANCLSSSVVHPVVVDWQVCIKQYCEFIKEICNV